MTLNAERLAQIERKITILKAIDQDKQQPPLNGMPTAEEMVEVRAKYRDHLFRKPSGK